MYLKVLTRWISILNLALFCSTLPVALLVVDLPPSHSLLLWFGFLRTSSRSARCSLVSVNLSSVLCCSTPCVTLLILVLSPSQSLFFVLLNTSSRSARCRHVTVSIFAALVCSKPRVDLLVVDLSQQSRQSVSTFRALCWNLDLLCLQFSCLWRLFKYSYFRWTGSCRLMFHSPKLLSIRPFSHRFEFGFCLAAFSFLYFCYCFPQTFTQYPTFACRCKKDRSWCIYIYINSMWDWIRMDFPW